MDTLEQKIAYLKGYAEALELDTTSKEGKLLIKLVEIISDMADVVCETADIQDDMTDRIDEIEDEIEYLEDDFYAEEDDDDDDCDCDCDCDEDYLADIECPDCGETIHLTDEMFEEESISCPNCNKKFELAIDDDCDCGCGHEHE